MGGLKNFFGGMPASYDASVFSLPEKKEPVTYLDAFLSATSGPAAVVSVAV